MYQKQNIELIIAILLAAPSLASLSIHNDSVSVEVPAARIPRRIPSRLAAVPRRCGKQAESQEVHLQLAMHAPLVDLQIVSFFFCTQLSKVTSKRVQVDSVHRRGRVHGRRWGRRHIGVDRAVLGLGCEGRVLLIARKHAHSHEILADIDAIRPCARSSSDSQRRRRRLRLCRSLPQHEDPS